MSWPQAKLEALAADIPHAFVGGPFGSNLTTRDYVDSGVPVIRGSNMNGGRYLGTTGLVFVSEAKVRKDLSSNVAREKDLIFTQRGTLGQVVMIPKTGLFPLYVVSQSQMKLTVDESKADRRFIYYYFSSPTGVGRITNLASSSGVPHINLTVLRNFELPVPPLRTQHHIADILSAYDDLIENNRRRIALLEQAARELYREWFVRLRFPGHENTRIVDGQPEGWERKKIADVCLTTGGGTPSTRRAEYWDGDITWIVPTDVTNNDCLVLLDSARKISDKGLRESSARMVPAETILMTSRASVGFFAMMDREFCTNQGFINVVPHDEKIRLYLLFNLINRVPEIRSNAQGTTYPEISKGRFREMDVVIPKRAIAAEFSRKASEFIDQVRCLKRSTSVLTQARDILLPRLMSGKVAV